MINRRIKLFLTFVCLAILGSAPGVAQSTFTVESVVDLQRVTRAVIQPQGDFVAYELRAPRGAEEKPGGGYTELWVVSTKTQTARAFVRKPRSVSSVAWTPDGQMITFQATRKAVNAHSQVYAIPVDGGEARLLSNAPRSISAYALSPDGKSLAYTMKDELSEAVKKDKDAGFDAKVEGTWHQLTRLYVEDLGSGENRLVSQSDENVWRFNWAPDGSELIYQGSDRPFTDDSYMSTDNYRVPAAGGAGVKVLDTTGKLGLAQVAPGGRHSAWLGATVYKDPYAGSLFVLASGSETPRNLLVDAPFTAQSFVWKDRRTILLSALEDTRTSLYEISVKDGSRRKIYGDTGPMFGSISLTKDKKHFATTGNTAAHPDEVFIGTTDGAGLTRLTNTNPQLADMAFGRQETVRWKGPDDLEISGVLVYPVNYREGQKYPLQMQVHGGPEAARLDGWNTYYNRPVQLLAQQGIMVLIPNYRGSIGKGVEFSMGDHRDMMGKEFEDMLAGIDYLADQGMVDTARVGIGGGSYGGYTAAWAATRHSERFAAATVFVGISNQISKGGMTDTPVENAVVHWTTWLYDDFDLVWDRSPLKHIKNAQTPTLILHGENDKRVPINQAFELYRGLQYVGVESELIVYPREGHGNRERSHQIDYLRRVLEWYTRYLLPTPGISVQEPAN